MKTQLKRLFCSLLAFVLVLGSVPTAFARIRPVTPADSGNSLNMSVSESGMLTWDKVSGATGYRVTLTQPNISELTHWDVTDAYLNLVTELDGLKYDSGEYILGVAAKGVSADETMLYYYTSHVDQLESPNNLVWIGNKAAWDAVEGATSYNVSLYDLSGHVVTIPTTDCLYDFSGNSPQDGWTFRVQALSNGTWSAKRYSTAVESPAKGTRIGAITPVNSGNSYNMRISNGGTLSWDKVTGATGYRVTLTQPNVSELTHWDVTDTYLNLITEMNGFKYNSGSYIVALSPKGVSGDDTVTFYYTSHVDQLESPNNLVWIGDKAAWDAVEGATSYNVSLYDFSGKVVTVPTTECLYDFSGSSPQNGWTFRVQALSNGTWSAKRYSTAVESPARDARIPITGISLKGIPVPVAGESAELIYGSNLTESTDGKHKYRIIDNQNCPWRDEEGRAIQYGRYAFEAGRTYSVSFNVAPMDGYVFNSADIPAELYNLYPYQYTSSVELSGNGYAEVTFTFTVDGERTYDDIDEFSFYQLRRPQDGDQAQYMGLWSYNNSEMTDRWWADANGNRIPNGTTFVGGRDYSYNLEFTAFDGYKFAADVWIKDSNGTVDWDYSFNADNTKIYIKIPYSVKAAETVTSIVIDGMFTPTQGGTTRNWDSNLYLSVPQNAGYTVPNQTTGWYEKEVKYSTETQYKVKESGFYAGKEYKMFLIVHAKDEYKFTTENLSVELTDVPAELYTYTVHPAGSEGIVELVVTFTPQFPEGAGGSAANPAFCYSYSEFKYAMESEDIRYVALGNVDDMLPYIPHDPEVPDNREVAIVVQGRKDLNLLGDATFTCPIVVNYDYKTYEELITLADYADSDLYIHGTGSLTFEGSNQIFYNSAIRVQGGSLTVDGATVAGSYGNHTGYCYGINAVYGSVSIQGGATVRGGVYEGQGIYALSVGGEGFTRSLSVSIWDGNLYVDRVKEGGYTFGGQYIPYVDYGISVQNDCGLRIYGGTFDGIELSRYAADTLDDYVMSGRVVTVNGVKTDPASCGTTLDTIEIYKEVPAVNVHVNSPAAGGDIPLYAEDVYTVPEGARVQRITWYENGETPSTSQFIAGKTYTVEIALAAEEGARFAVPLTSAAINYKTATVTPQSSGAKYGVILTVDFGTCPATVPEVELTVTAPKEGSKPSYSIGVGSNAYYAVGGNSNYTDYRKWYMSSDNDDWWEINGNHAFMSGYYYKLVVDIRTNNGYEFPLIDNGTIQPNVSATVNGYSATVIKAYDQDPSRYITVEYNFGECNDSVVEQIVVENVTAPVAGQKPSYTWSVRGTGYQMNTAKNAYYDVYWKNPPEKWYYIKNGIGWFDLTDSDWVYENETFIPGHEYRANVYLITEDGYEFAHTKYYEPTVAATVNGNTATPFTTGSDCVRNQQVLYTFTCATPETSLVMVTDLAVPVEGRAPDHEITAVHSSYYMPDPNFGFNGIYWYDSEDNLVLPSDTFRKGEQYRVEIKLIPVKAEGVNMCTFISPVDAYVNGNQLDAGDVYASSGAVYLYYTFPRGAVSQDEICFVGGTVSSFGGEAPVTVQLIPQGSSEPACETVVYGNSAAYYLAALPGNYVIRATKLGHLIYEAPLTVEGTSITCDIALERGGDVDGTGEVNTADLVALLQYLAGTNPTPFSVVAADLNGDSRVSVSDAVILARLLAE